MNCLKEVWTLMDIQCRDIVYIQDDNVVKLRHENYN